MAKTSVAQSVQRRSRDPGSRVQFLAGGLGVAFFATGPSWVLKINVYISDTQIYLTLKNNIQYLLTTSVNTKLPYIYSIYISDGAIIDYNRLYLEF